ncbi:MAG: ribosomal RNA small subunit methyltransferase A [Armatimonadetes bacterium]|nr:ribosomal RNA small subunit methyltransferase A [Armatimonadota bacterium]
MSPAKDLHQARASASADQARRGLVPSAWRSLAGRTRDLLQRHGLRPRKSLGQNFLLNAAKVERIANAAVESAAGGPIIEIGAGLGALTVALATHGNRVVAFEIDRRLQAPLTELLSPFDNVELRFADFLEADLEDVAVGRPFVAAGNLPYQITTPLLEKLFLTPLCRALVVTMQREVAQRLVARPGGKTYGPLTLFCQYYVERAETVCELPPGDFLPEPEVSSTALRLVKRPTPPFADPDASTFQQVVRAAFNQRRKAVRSALAGSPLLPADRDGVTHALLAAGIDGQRRAETLTMDEFAALGRELQRLGQTGP